MRKHCRKEESSSQQGHGQYPEGEKPSCPGEQVHRYQNGCIPWWGDRSTVKPMGMNCHSWVGVERVFKSPWGLCRGLWCGCRSHRLGCNQLWATSLPGWSGVVSSSSPPCLAVGALVGNWCLLWSPSSVWLLAPSKKRQLCLVSRGTERREAADPVSAVRVLPPCPNTLSSPFPGLAVHWAN